MVRVIALQPVRSNGAISGLIVAPALRYASGNTRGVEPNGRVMRAVAAAQEHFRLVPGRSVRIAAAACRVATALLMAGVLLAVPRFGSAAVQASGLTIELKDVASDRVERQRAAALGALPLPGTPDLSNRAERLAAKGLKIGDQVFIRIFKSESELEVWMRKESGEFILFETYPICHWSGTLGPKVEEGDKQNPEGFYTVTRQQLHLVGRWPRSLNLGFPNPYDKALGRTGSYILVHGGCTSVGCFAMTNAVVAEIYDLAEAALRKGQAYLHVHAFPFRMTDENLARHAESPWRPFWSNLKEGYDAFEQTRVPPRVGVCSNRYSIKAIGPEEGPVQSPLAVCGETLAAIRERVRLGRTATLRQASTRPSFQPSSRTSALPVPSPQSADETAQTTTLPLPGRLSLIHI